MSPKSPDPAFIESMNGLVHEAQETLFASHDADLQRQVIEQLAAVGPASSRASSARSRMATSPARWTSSSSSLHPSG